MVPGLVKVLEMLRRDGRFDGSEAERARVIVGVKQRYSIG